MPKFIRHLTEQVYYFSGEILKQVQDDKQVQDVKQVQDDKQILGDKH